MKCACEKISGWLLTMTVFALFVVSAFGQNKNGDTGGIEYEDYNTCQNSPQWICPDCSECECTNDKSRTTDCVNDESDKHSRSFSPIGVLLSYGESYAFIDDDGPNASPVGSSCASCGTTGPGIPEESQLPRLRLQRIYRSTFVHRGSFGISMYTSYDYEVKSSLLPNGDTVVQFTDPNTGNTERFIDQSGGAIDFVNISNVDYHTEILDASAAGLTVVKVGGLRLRFEWTSFVDNGAYTHARLEHIEDRNGNQINFQYDFPQTEASEKVFNWAAATDSYGRSLEFNYDEWNVGNDVRHVVKEVILPDGRVVEYFYETAVNTLFVNRIKYGSSAIESSLTYNGVTKTSERNEALLAADHYKQLLHLSTFTPGRTRSLKRADSTLLYSRVDLAAGNTYKSTIYDRGETFEIISSPLKTLISHRQKKVGGSWEDLTNYDAPDKRPVVRIAQPDARNWAAEREDGDNERLTRRTYPDGSVEEFTYNDFAQMTSRTHRSGAIEKWDYDARGNLISHTEAVGVVGVEAAESWEYNSRGQVEKHTDFNGNVTTYEYEADGDLAKIILPSGTGQPSGEIEYSYDDAGRILSITDPAARKVSFDYDAAGRLIKTTFGVINTSTEELTYGTGEFSARLLSKKDRNGNQTLYTYDNTGRVLTTKVEEAGSGKILSTLTNTWDAATGRLMAVDRDGDSTEYTYDHKGRVLTTTVHPKPSKNLITRNVYDQYHLLSTTDPYDRTTFYLYDELDHVKRLVRETVPGAIADNTNLATLLRDPGPNAPYLIEDFKYDEQERLIEYIDGKGVLYQYGYDARDRRTLEHSAVGAGMPVEATKEYTYDGNNNQLTMTDEKGQVWTKTYTARNAVLTDANPLGHTSEYAYYADGLRKSETNPNGHTTEYVYDTCCGFEADGRLIEKKDANGETAEYEYDHNGNRRKLTDESGRVVTYAYDGLNRLTKTIVDPGALNLQTSTIYDQTPGTIGRKGIVTSPANQVTTTSYDGLARVASVTGDTPQLTYTYDVMETKLLKTRVTDANGNNQSSLTDGAGRTIKTVDGLNHTTSMFYDNNGNLVRNVDRDGKRTRYDYDARNRRTGVIGDEGGINAATSFEYDAVGNVLKITDAELKTTKYEYDNAHRRSKATYAAGTAEEKSWSFTYTPLGQLDLFIKPKETIDHDYDNLERLSTRTYSTGGVDSFTYHANSLLKTAVGGLYNTSIDRSNLNADYDGANRLVQERQDIGAGAKTISYSYEKDGLVQQITYPGGTQVQQTYTPRRELFEMRIGGIVQATHTYDPAGRRQSRKYANNRVTKWTYDNEDRITRLNHEKVQTWTYSYTDGGDPRVQNDLTTPTRGEAYKYDGLHRLSDPAADPAVKDYKRGKVVGNDVPSPLFTQDWTLDKVGNWTKWNNNGANEAREHNSHHALVKRDAAQQTYDANLNQTYDGVSPFTLEYDANDRLKQVKRQIPGGFILLAEYRYDALGRRIEKWVNESPEKRVRYYYSGDRIVEERDGSDAVAAIYTYGDYIDEPLTMDRGGSRFYYHSNRMYSTYALTNAAGNIVERYSYTPYGEVTTFDAAYQNAALISRVGNPFTFTGRELDAETGLMHYRARAYDPVQGRFKQRDPLGYVDGMNLYEYVRSNPVLFGDPSGLVEWNFQNIKKIPWSDAEIAGDVRGYTLPMELKIECKCKCCNKEKDKWNYKCTVTLNIWIFIDVKDIKALEKKDKSWTVEGTYGHEQLHAKDMQDAVKERISANAKPYEDNKACNKTKAECEADKKKVEDDLLDAAKNALKERGAGHGKVGQPVAGTPNAPVEGTDVAGNEAKDPKKKPPSPLKPPDNLAGVWQHYGWKPGIIK